MATIQADVVGLSELGATYLATIWGNNNIG